MSQDPAVTLAKEAHLRSFAKAVSWRIVGSLDTFVLSFLVTGNLVWAGAIAPVETPTQIVLFFRPASLLRPARPTQNKKVVGNVPHPAVRPPPAPDRPFLL